MSTGLPFDESAARAVEALYRTPDVVGQRCQTLAALALRPGERVLDVGAGPGLLALDLMRTVGAEGSVAAIDASEAMIAMARERCGGEEAIDLRRADATRLPFADASFDAVVSTQVYEYVADLEQALAEVARVLRPGGRVVIVDTDWDTAVWHTADRDRMRRVLRAWEEHLHDPFLPRTLGARLEAAGLRVVRRDVIPLVNPALHAHCYSFGMLAMIERFVAGRRGVDPEEAAAWAAEQRRLGAEGRYFFSINRYLFGAVRV